MTAQRICDVFLAFVLLLVCLPMMSIACLITMLELKAPPFVRRDGFTPDGRIVRVFQLRTGFARDMSPHSPPMMRIIRRLHIDQVPKLLNVLLGDLSLVGHGRDDVAGRGLLAWRER